MTAATSNLHDWVTYWVTYKDAREVLTGQTVAVEANPDYRSSCAAPGRSSTRRHYLAVV